MTGKYREKKGKTMKAFGWVVVIFGASALFFLLMSVVIVRPGTCGVPVRLGAVQDQPLDEGLHFITPIVTRVEMINLKIQKNTLSADAATKDLQDVQAEIALNYAAVKEGAPTLFQTVGTNYFETIISPLVMEVFKAEAAKYNAEELITQRSIVSQSLFASLDEKLAAYKIKVTAFSITQFKFSEEFNNAIEQKIIAEQRALQAERELERVKFEALQAEEKAKGDAAAIIAKAEAEAQSLKLRSEATTANVLILEAITKWDGKLPTHLLGSAAIPFANVGDVGAGKSSEAP